ncbi:hypothetical protein [Tropicimonas sp. IMCC34043]|uniref:hypothetical protein n=1 Tax=Tropicimonas sp. IMCC34043 TaxID=2248760 RepID=UPI000E24BBC5|nr:hypothetical protein [Tropicimonas sp. IMCC34043]
MGLIVISAGLATAASEAAAGPWPRGKGHFFASVAWSSWGDLLGYYDALQETFVEAPQLTTTEELTFFAEYGVTDRVTVGVDSHRRPEEESGANIWFVRATVGPRDWSSQYAVELGLGNGRSYTGETDTVTRAAFLWGRGFSTFGIDGWADVNARVESLAGTEDVLYKVDSTFGVKPDDKRLIYIQMQSGKLGENPGFTRVVPTYVRNFGPHLSLESAFLYGIENDDSLGVKFGVWTQF